MINWELLQPRNLAVVAFLAVLAYGIYNHFTKASAVVNPTVGA